MYDVGNERFGAMSGPRGAITVFKRALNASCENPPQSDTVDETLTPGHSTKPPKSNFIEPVRRRTGLGSSKAPDGEQQPQQSSDQPANYYVNQTYQSPGSIASSSNTNPYVRLPLILTAIFCSV